MRYPASLHCTSLNHKIILIGRVMWRSPRFKHLPKISLIRQHCVVPTSGHLRVERLQCCAWHPNPVFWPPMWLKKIPKFPSPWTQHLTHLTSVWGSARAKAVPAPHRCSRGLSTPATPHTTLWDLPHCPKAMTTHRPPTPNLSSCPWNPPLDHHQLQGTGLPNTFQPEPPSLLNNLQAQPKDSPLTLPALMGSRCPHSPLSLTQHPMPTTQHTKPLHTHPGNLFFFTEVANLKYN